MDVQKGGEAGVDDDDMQWLRHLDGITRDGPCALMRRHPDNDMLIEWIRSCGRVAQVSVGHGLCALKCERSADCDRSGQQEGTEQQGPDQSDLAWHGSNLDDPFPAEQSHRRLPRRSGRGLCGLAL